MPRRPATLTSPAPCGAFLYPSAYPFNGPAFTPFPSHLGPLPLRGASLALPCCHPFPPRLGQARALGRQPYALALGKPRLVAELNPLPYPFRVRDSAKSGARSHVRTFNVSTQWTRAEAQRALRRSNMQHLGTPHYPTIDALSGHPIPLSME